MIMSLYAVFAALGFCIVLGESLITPELTVAALRFTGMLIAQLHARQRA